MAVAEGGTFSVGGSGLRCSLSEPLRSLGGSSPDIFRKTGGVYSPDAALVGEMVLRRWLGLGLAAAPAPPSCFLCTLGDSDPVSLSLFLFSIV